MRKGGKGKGERGGRRRGKEESKIQCKTGMCTTSRTTGHKHFPMILGGHVHALFYKGSGTKHVRTY